MNEEEKKVEKQEQLFDLGNGRFVDINKLIQVAQQDDNQDLYTSSWSLGSRRNAIKTSINETLQAIKDGIVTGRNADKTYNFNQDILQQTGRRFDPYSVALDYLNWIFDSEQAPEAFYTQPKPKEEPKKEEPKKFTRSTVSKYFTKIGLFNPDGTLDRATYEVNDIDPKTKKLINTKNRLDEVKNYFTGLDNLITTVGDDGSRSSTWDFSDEESPFASYEDYDKAFTAIKNAGNFAQLRQALSSYGIQNEGDWVRTDEAVVERPLTHAEQHQAWQNQRNAETIRRNNEIERVLADKEQDWYNHYSVTYTKPQNAQTYQPIQVSGNRVPNPAQLESEIKQGVLDTENWANYVDYYQAVIQQLLNNKIDVLKDSKGHYYLSDVSHQKPFYLAYDQAANKVHLKWVDDDTQVQNQLRTAWFDNERNNLETSMNNGTYTYKYYPTLKQGGVLKGEHGLISDFDVDAYNKKFTADSLARVTNERTQALLESRQAAERVDSLQKVAQAIKDENYETAVNNNASDIVGLDFSDPYLKGAMADFLGMLLSFGNTKITDVAGGIAGLTGTGYTLVGDINNEAMRQKPWKIVGNTLKNVGFDLMGYLPNWLTANSKIDAKSKRVTLAKAMPILTTILTAPGIVKTVSNPQEIINSINVAFNTPEMLTAADLQNINTAINLTAGVFKGGVSYVQQRGKPVQTSTSTQVKGKKGSVEVTPDQLRQLREARDAKDYNKANDLFQDLGGTQLPYTRKSKFPNQDGYNVLTPVIDVEQVPIYDTKATPWPWFDWWNSGTNTKPAAPAPAPAPAPAASTTPKTTSNTKKKNHKKKKEQGGKLNQLKALREGGVLKFQSGNTILDDSSAQRFEEYKKWYETKYGTEKANALNPSTYMISNDFEDYVKSTTNVDNSDITQTSWRDTRNQKYFNGTTYNDQATKDFHRALNVMDPIKRQEGLDALSKVDQNDVILWNETFNKYFGQINQHIVGYNPEVDNYDGVSTQFRKTSIASYNPFNSNLEIAGGTPVEIEGVDQNFKITAPESIKTAANAVVEETYKRSAAGRRPKIGEEDQYKKVSGLYDLDQLGIKNDAISDYAEEMSDLYQDNIFRPTAYQIQAPKVTNLFEQRMVKQQQDAQDFFRVGQNLAALNPDQYKQYMLGLVSSQANSDMQFNMQERAHLDQQYQNLAEIDNTNAKARLDAYQEGLKNQLSANVTTGAMLAEANKAIQNNWGDYMTQLKLNQQQDVKDWNAALYANEVDKAKLDYQNAVDYANLHLADDPVAWREYVNKAASALATVESEQRNKMYGFNTRQTGPNYGALSAKKGGKLDSDTKLQIENSRFLSKQIIQQLKSRDKGLDRLSKITYKTILKSLGLE